MNVELVPFLWAAGAWAAVGLGLCGFFSSDPETALRSFALYFSLAVIDLFFIVKTVAATLVLMSDQGAKSRTAYAIQAVVFGSLKFLCLGTIGICLWKIPSRASGGVFLGLSALVVVPLLGGLLWSRKKKKSGELKETE